MENLNFNSLKEKGIVYTLEWDGHIDSYNLKNNPKELFDVDNNYFSDGWGGAWKYSDFNITWSFDKTILMERLYNDFQKNNVKFLNILYALKTDKKYSLNIIYAYLYGFYGTMYGGEYGSSEPNSELVHITSSEVSKTDGSLIYVWGMPGPDYNRYKPEDYGKTWALTKEELNLK